MTVKQNELNWRGTESLSLLCVKERTPVASGPDWSSRVPVARQPSSGVWGLVDRQQLMKPGQRVERACCRKGLSNLPSHASHVLGSCCTQVHGCTSIPPHHTCTHTYTHQSACAQESFQWDQGQLLDCSHVLDSPHLLYYHHPPHHAVTNIYTAKNGIAYVITTCVVKVSEGANWVSFSHNYVRELGNRGVRGVKTQMASTQTWQPQSRVLIASYESRSGHTCRSCGASVLLNLLGYTTKFKRVTSYRNVKLTVRSKIFRLVIVVCVGRYNLSPKCFFVL